MLNTTIEDNFSEFSAVERAILLKNFGTERSDDFFPGIFPGLDDLSGQFVGVNYGGPQSRQNGSDGAFTRCDPSG